MLYMLAWETDHQPPTAFSLHYSNSANQQLGSSLLHQLLSSLYLTNTPVFLATLVSPLLQDLRTLFLWKTSKYSESRKLIEEYPLCNESREPSSLQKSYSVIIPWHSCTSSRHWIHSLNGVVNPLFAGRLKYNIITSSPPQVPKPKLKQMFRFLSSNQSC